ncbi:hypothetical protein [Amycolatopsis sp. NPDC004079]|uniref:hypothetical protein n=1 Tax=Amycolatopsis sp. NPDC004079 TaxID=3154549 RepID=UPI0033BEFC7D
MTASAASDPWADDAIALYARFRAGELSPDDLLAELPQIWRCRPRRDPLGNPEAWRRMFEHAGYFEWKSGESRGRRARRPWRRQLLYRGATEDRRLGLSWTKNPRIAEHFARHRQPDGETGHVWTGVFAPSLLLARVRDEQEFLVRAGGAKVRRLRTPVP